MIFIKNKDMKIPKPLSKAVSEALKENYSIQLIINGEYYDVAKSFKGGN